MGTFIFILIPILYFFYQAYLNFKKEQEKAENRKQKSFVPVSENINRQEYSRDANDEKIEESPFSSRDFYKNKRLVELSNQAEIRAQRRTATKNEATDYYNPEVPTEEVLEGRKLHALHPHQFEFPHGEKGAEVEFNLREAIIQQAILNRPQY